MHDGSRDGGFGDHPPAGLHLHCWGASLNGGYGWWYRPEAGSYLISSNQIPYDWWTGYHERKPVKGAISQADADKGVVRPYSTTRMLAFYDWAAKKYNLDPNRLAVAGSSMDIQLSQSVPAFTGCSLDDNVGNGDPADGDLKGQTRTD